MTTISMSLKITDCKQGARKKLWASQTIKVTAGTCGGKLQTQPADMVCAWDLVLDWLRS